MSTDAVTGRGRDWLHADVEAASRAVRARMEAPNVLERRAVVMKHLTSSVGRRNGASREMGLKKV
jgi:hypothetical protein